MTMHIKVSGTWKEITAPGVKVSGAWKDISEGWIKVSGVWKQLYAIAGGGDACSLAGSLSSSDDAPTIVSTAIEVDVPGGNSGKLYIANVTSSGGSGTFSWRKNSDAFQFSVTSASPITFADTDTITARCQGLDPGESISFDVYDFDSNTLIQSAAITRTI